MACLQAAVAEAQRLLYLDDLREDRGEIDLIDEATGEVLRTVPAPIAVVSDNGPCFRGAVFAEAFTGDDPLLRHVRTRVRSPQTNGVIERFFGTLKYEHLFRGPIPDAGALAVEVGRFRQIYNTIRPHQALGDRTPTRRLPRRRLLAGWCLQRTMAPVSRGRSSPELPGEQKVQMCGRWACMDDVVGPSRRRARRRCGHRVLAVSLVRDVDHDPVG